jgi:hypothetical protein
MESGLFYQSLYIPAMNVITPTTLATKETKTMLGKLFHIILLLTDFEYLTI